MDGYDDTRNSVRYPLDHALGSEGQVRLLRVLLTHGDLPLSVSDAARLAGLTPAGARRALDRLRSAGFVRRIGSGHALKYGARDDAAGIQALARAFEDEQHRYDRFIALLKEAVSIPEVNTAWIDSLPEKPSDSACLSTIVETRSVSWIQEELRTRLIAIEREFDMIIEIATHTKADAPTPSSEAIMLWGVLPGSGKPKRPAAKTHAAAIDRGLRMSQAIADLIHRDPTLIDRARRHVIRLLSEEQGVAQADLREWRQLLESYSPDRMADLLESGSSRAERLRQSSPFFAVLTVPEREMVLDRLEQAT